MSMPQRRKSAIDKRGIDITGEIQTLDQQEHLDEIPGATNPMMALRQFKSLSSEGPIGTRERAGTLDMGVNLNELTAGLHQPPPPVSPALANQYPTVIDYEKNSKSETFSTASVASDRSGESMFSLAMSEDAAPTPIDACKELHTNAFGQIRFVGDRGISKYVKVREQEMATVIRDFLLQGVWQLNEPNIIISVTGGAQALEGPKALKDKFKDEIAKAAHGSNAWVITGGMGAGVMQLVGEAKKESGMDITVIGIVPWGCVANRHLLVNGGDTVDVDYQTHAGELAPDLYNY
jgi:hypothetical protein